MPDGAISTDPAVQAQLDRLFAHGPGTDTLGLDRISRLLARLGDPHRHLPPVFHVAGTNGKGSTCAFLRAALEAAGHRVHVYTSPHLVRFNERIRLAGRLIEDAALAPLLAEVLDAAEDLRASFFEVTTAAAFLAFARTPADACVVEVGLGGRLDATNVIPSPAVCGIAGLGIDHQAFLGDTLTEIAAEKAGIAKPGVPIVTMAYPADIAGVIEAIAVGARAPVFAAGAAWSFSITGAGVLVSDASGEIELPRPTLPGAHQAANLALAAAMLRRQRALAVPDRSLQAAATTARWPARLQRLGSGPLTRKLNHRSLWLDGAHNAAAAAELARSMPPFVSALVIGILANKDADEVLSALAGMDAVVAVPVPGHAHHAPAALASRAALHNVRWTARAETLPEALDLLADRTDDILIAGSLYLAGEALRLNEELPD
ncbi:bifunctional folylpolyglutamate synthase/dihydrofolate synthase [Sphingomonas sp.]|jgi:dihydrofolate synthase/folylpolyglutamate synthase|uniref:bifunctional folylpolyglutamate synthase/dihydrofolate synthase n=1 Tax=Sphingomonas sp. TaxID=28214 RepID=UPI002D810790|nr:bifunctional folylpolyglutamate synthase/dihydrofolate synthase [Sphingomonas sp.]HEU0045117.1 bifunctional folylpolyglutamate synthase/dihydrofolate synthase [Sphingomonas sp.]